MLEPCPWKNRGLADSKQLPKPGFSLSCSRLPLIRVSDSCFRCLGNYSIISRRTVTVTVVGTTQACNVCEIGSIFRHNGKRYLPTVWHKVAEASRHHREDVLSPVIVAEFLLLEVEGEARRRRTPAPADRVIGSGVSPLSGSYRCSRPGPLFRPRCVPFAEASPIGNPGLPSRARRGTAGCSVPRHGCQGRPVAFSQIVRRRVRRSIRQMRMNWTKPH